jgi:hypothetical protein
MELTAPSAPQLIATNPEDRERGAERAARMGGQESRDRSGMRQVGAA